MSTTTVTNRIKGRVSHVVTRLPRRDSHHSHHSPAHHHLASRLRFPEARRPPFQDSRITITTTGVSNRPPYLKLAKLDKQAPDASDDGSASERIAIEKRHNPPHPP